MTAGVRKAALTLHVSSSVGWLGAVVGFLALAIAGLASADENTVRGSYVAMELLGWSVIVPLAFAATPTGIVMSLGTEWGLFRHYWVLAKLLITAAATVLLLVHMRPVGHLAEAVVSTATLDGELAGMRLQLVADAGAATVALLAATALSVYKPRGLTPFACGATVVETSSAPRRWPRRALIAVGVGLGIFGLVHLLTGGMAH